MNCVKRYLHQRHACFDESHKYKSICIENNSDFLFKHLNIIESFKSTNFNQQTMKFNVKFIGVNFYVSWSEVAYLYILLIIITKN